MVDLPQITAAAALAQRTPMLDLRAPTEFAKGAPAGAINLPLLTDAERHRIGITYRQQGQAAAIKLGHKLVTGELKEQRINGWKRACEDHTQGLLYCWRGGLRSELVGNWLNEAGVQVKQVTGGFKALRSTALARIEEVEQQANWWVLGGRTGSGKTVLLQQLANAVDLEGAAQHRGSAFGAQIQPQPTPIAFEFRLASAWQEQQERQQANASGGTHKPTLVVEDESRAIGRLGLPTAWFQSMQSAPIALLEVPFAERVENIATEYARLPLAQGYNPEALHQHYANALLRIKRRLGGALWKDIDDALTASFASNDHRPWIAALLERYYDPMYDYQLEKKQARVKIQGDAQELIDFLRAQEI